VAELGPLAATVTIAEAAPAEVLFLTVRWANISQALQGLPDWQDTNNAILSDGTFMDLGEQALNEFLAAQLPSAGVVKAFNSLFAAWLEAEPVQPAGHQVPS